MTEQQINLVESSWDFIITNTSQAGEIFYKKLFELDPSLKAIFRTDIKQQAHKLTSMITFIVHKLNNFEEVKNDIQDLGKRHRGYQVNASHFETVAVALLYTLELALQNKWNDEMKDAWGTVYNILSQTMINAMNEVEVN